MIKACSFTMFFNSMARKLIFYDLIMVIYIWAVYSNHLAKCGIVPLMLRLPKTSKHWIIRLYGKRFTNLVQSCMFHCTFRMSCSKCRTGFAIDHWKDTICDMDQEESWAVISWDQYSIMKRATSLPFSNEFLKKLFLEGSYGSMAHLKIFEASLAS
jgi:hypothetical protein